MGYWNSRGLRGSVFEELINLTNEQYEKRGIALIQKIPTPIKPVEFDTVKRTIKLAYFEQKSTVDYIGVMDGIPICFDAKETGRKSLPFSNIHEHQVRFMKEFDRQGGIAFLLVHFTTEDVYYLLPLETLCRYFEHSDTMKVHSIPREAFEERYRINPPEGGLFNYLRTALDYYEDKKRKTA
ncbi:MAG: Holliday junction resolvase RecU [Firmicutes bacterium]|nr:Holliday junction resolvase RecU [Bacillota bacterium]